MTALGVAEKYEVHVLERGGGALLRKLNFTQLTWNRGLNEPSNATVNVNGACAADLEFYGFKGDGGQVARPSCWQHELGIFRNGELVWVGPLTMIREEEDTLTFGCRDLSQWLRKRLITESRLWNDADYGQMARTVINDAVAADPSMNMEVSITKSGISGGHEILASEGLIASRFIEEIQDIGFDWTVFKREFIGGGRVGVEFVPTLLDEHFNFFPSYTQDGIAQLNFIHGNGANTLTATRQTNAANHDRYGLLQGSFDNSELESAGAVQKEARSILQILKEPVEVLGGAMVLDPTAPIGIDELIPGTICSLSLTDRLYPIEQPMRIRRVTGAAGPASDRIALQLEPVGQDDPATDVEP